MRLEHGDWFNAPWGLTLAPTDFGAFSHKVIVGQFGSGEILAFDAITGRFEGKFKDQNDTVISINGLWALAFGDGLRARILQINLTTRYFSPPVLTLDTTVYSER